MKTLSQKEIQAFRNAVRTHFKKEGRELPWRKTQDPHRILVSEIMLQQTQVDRVLPKYTEFLKRFPTVKKLAEASLGDVLRVWSGLGYNRRAKMLHACAQEVARARKGKFPSRYEDLMSLPGIGPYTAGAVMAFAYDAPVVMIETNIRSVYLHHFFQDKKDISDAELLPLIEKTLDRKQPRLWYNMLMDYGTWIKKEHGNPNKKSKHHVVQKKFEGSNRQVRGNILRILTRGASSTPALAQELVLQKEVLEEQLQKLNREGLVVSKKQKWFLP